MEFEPPTKDGTKLADGQHHADATELAGAWINFGASNLLEPIEELQLQDRGQFKRQTEDAACVLEFGAARGMMQAKMANADKALWQDMGEEATDELDGGQGHDFLFALVAVVEILKGDGIAGNGNKAMVGNGNAEDIPSEIFDQFLWVIQGSLDKDFPSLGQGVLQHALNIERAMVHIQFALCPKLGESKAEAIAELVGK